MSPTTKPGNSEKMLLSEAISLLRDYDSTIARSLIDILGKLAFPRRAKGLRGRRRQVRLVWVAECIHLATYRRSLPDDEEPVDWDAVAMLREGWRLAVLVRTFGLDSQILNRAIKHRFSITNSTKHVHLVRDIYKFAPSPICPADGAGALLALNPEIVTCSICKGLEVERALRQAEA